MSQTIITRFAPSPTGYLHIGGARTALFNWLYARGVHADKKSRFLLRIEDTDRARHNEDAVAAILDGLAWLGLDWDGAPVSQYTRIDRHREVAHALLTHGHAYRCWLEGEELEQARQAAQQQKIRFSSPWRDAPPSRYPDKPFAIRLKAPQSHETVVRDMIQGNVTFSADALDDMILLRADGTPTYMLAVVVDDHDMAITHIVRGDDHLVNAARQQQLFTALDWPVPCFAHMPLIHGADGTKLSKRHGALGVQAYREMGYLPQGLMNYLLRLGWSHGDDEIILPSQALAWFDVKNITKGPSRLDMDKLAHVNAQHMRYMADSSFLTALTAHLPPLCDTQKEQISRAIPFLKERAKTFIDAGQAAAFILQKRPLMVSGKAARPLNKDGALTILEAVHAFLEHQQNWTIESLETAMDEFAAARGMGFGQIGPPIRAALTAGAPAPGLADVLYALGKTESLSRIKDQVSTKNKPSA